MPDKYEYCNSAYFQDQCLQNMITYALDTVMKESDVTQYHSERVRLSGKLFNNTIPMRTLAMSFIANPTIAEKITNDQLPIGSSDLEYQTTQIYNALAITIL